jgi:hypothetical protein
MNIPKKVIVYDHYCDSIYFDGLLVKNFPAGSYSTAGWRELCQLLGIEFECRQVKWEDWPGQDKNTTAVYNPPKELAVVESHFAKLAEQRRLERIEQLKYELAQLEGRV